MKWITDYSSIIFRLQSCRRESFRHLKGIVHPKIWSWSFTHPQVVPNLYEFICSAEQKDILKFVTRLQWCPRTAQFPHILQNIFFLFRRTKKFIQVWNYLRASKWQTLHFWVNHPFQHGQDTSWLHKTNKPWLITLGTKKPTFQAFSGALLSGLTADMVLNNDTSLFPITDNYSAFSQSTNLSISLSYIPLGCTSSKWHHQS